MSYLQRGRAVHSNGADAAQGERAVPVVLSIALDGREASLGDASWSSLAAHLSAAEQQAAWRSCSAADPATDPSEAGCELSRSHRFRCSAPDNLGRAVPVHNAILKEACGRCFMSDAAVASLMVVRYSAP